MPLVSPLPEVRCHSLMDVCRNRRSEVEGASCLSYLHAQVQGIRGEEPISHDLSDIAAGSFYRNSSGSNFRQWNYRDRYKTPSPALTEEAGENKGTAVPGGEWYIGPQLRGLSQGEGKDTPVYPCAQHWA